MTDSTLKAQIQHDLHDAMRARDKVRSGTLRMTLTSITNAEVAGDEARELSDDEVLKVVAKEAKKRKESSAAYTGAGRPELAAVEEAELVVLEGYLPAQLGDDQLQAIVARAVESTGSGHEGRPGGGGRTRRRRPGGRRRQAGAVRALNRARAGQPGGGGTFGPLFPPPPPPLPLPLLVLVLVLVLFCGAGCW